VEQVVRPTGLLEPPIEVRPSVNQVDDLLDEIDRRVKDGGRVLVTTLPNGWQRKWINTCNVSISNRATSTLK